jgi:hypothetical protein
MQRAAIAAVTAVLAAATLPPAVAQTAPPAAPTAVRPAYKAPRNALGQPDLSGYWTNASLTPEARPASTATRSTYTEAEVRKMEDTVVKEVEEGNQPTDPNAPGPKKGGETYTNVRPEFAAAGGPVGGYNRGWLEPGMTVMRVHGEPRTSFITTANGQPPPRKPGAPVASFGGGGTRARMGAFDSYEVRTLGERCLKSFGRNAEPPMFPNGFYNNNYEFVQSKDSIAILVEMVHDVRVVRLNAKHRTDGLRPWMGDSIGWWDGDTLVVETTNLPQREAYRGSWENLKVTERFTRVAPDRIYYQFTVEDPTMWEQPWGGEYEFASLKGQIYEYACHEGNYALTGMLAGARQEDEEKARAAGPAPAAAKSAP